MYKGGRMKYNCLFKLGHDHGFVITLICTVTAGKVELKHKFFWESYEKCSRVGLVLQEAWLPSGQKENNHGVMKRKLQFSASSRGNTPHFSGKR